VVPLTLLLVFIPPLSLQVGVAALERHCRLGSDPGRSAKFGLALEGLKLSWLLSPSPIDQGSPVPAWSAKR
jgi:hypothetical protein